MITFDPNRPDAVTLQDALANDGYASFPLLDQDDIEQLLTAFHRRYPSGQSGITFSNHRSNSEFAAEFDKAVRPIWERSIEQVLPNHRVVFTAIVVKHPGEDSSMGIHEDGTFVRPEDGTSLAVWLPLVDCGPSESNGMIGVIPRSHSAVTSMAGSNVPDWFDPYRDYLASKMTAVPTRAGDAVLWNTRLLHGSWANTGQELRPAVVAILAPRGVPLIHVEALSRTRRRIYEVDDEFHTKYSPTLVRHVMPAYPVVDELHEPSPTVLPAAVASLCESDDLPADARQRPTDDWYPPSRTDGPTSPANHGEPSEEVAGAVDAAVPMFIESIRRLLDDTGRVPPQRAGRFQPERMSDGVSWVVVADVDGWATSNGFRAAVVLALPPGTSIALPLAERNSNSELIIPLAAPTGPSGLSASGGVVPFEFARPLSSSSGAGRQLFNEGAEEMRVLLLQTDQRSGEAGEHWLRPVRRALDRIRTRSVQERRPRWSLPRQSDL